MLETAHRERHLRRWAAGSCSAARCPTPAVAHLTVSMRADAGIVISASHNPYQDNGIKIFGADGFKLPDEAEAEIERLIGDDRLLGQRDHRPRHRHAPRSSRTRAAATSSSLKNTFPRDLSLDGVRIVVDAAHGAAYRVAPLVFRSSAPTVTAIGVKPNGVNINKDVRRAASRPRSRRGRQARRGHRHRARRRRGPGDRRATRRARSSTATRAWRCARCGCSTTAR